MMTVMQNITKGNWLTGSQYDCNLNCTPTKSCAGVIIMRYNLTKTELEDLLYACSSVKRRVGKQIIWKKRAILDGAGRPIPLEDFMEDSEERIFQKTIIIEQNSKEEIKAAKEQYAAEMKKKFGPNWKKDLRGATMKLYTFSQLRILK